MHKCGKHCKIRKTYKDAIFPQVYYKHMVSKLLPEIYEMCHKAYDMCNEEL